MIKPFKALSNEERAHWDGKAVDDVERYEKEMAVFEKMHGSVIHQTPLFMYATSVRSNVKAVHPTANSERIDKICSYRFKVLPKEEIDYWQSSAL